MTDDPSSITSKPPRRDLPRSDTYFARSDTFSSNPNLQAQHENRSTKGCDDSTFNTRFVPSRGCGQAQAMEVVSWTLFC
jgi:hypothetical protein